jgi:aspartyl/asparaginyl-tRNA synthetase
VTDEQLLYRAYSAVMGSVAQFAAERGFTAVLPAATAPAPEFSPSETLVVDRGDKGRLILPASNTFQKQIAAAYLGRIYCIAASYRADNLALDPDDALCLPVFHQVEFEMSAATMPEAHDLAASLLRQLELSFAAALGRSDQRLFEAFDVIDLEAEAEADVPTTASYDAWADEVSRSASRPTWILHTPEERRRAANRLAGASTPMRRRRRLNAPTTVGELTLGFDLVLPDGGGELLSGGQRDPNETRSFFGSRSGVGGMTLGSSGFGIGLERLMRALIGADSVWEVQLPHARVWT